MGSEYEPGAGTRSRKRGGRRLNNSPQPAGNLPRRPGASLIGGLMLATFVFAGIAFALLGSVVPQFGGVESSSASGTNSSSSGGTPVSESTPTVAAEEPTVTSIVTPEATPTATSSPTFVVQTANGQGINLRADPGTDGAILAALPTGTEVIIIVDDETADGYTWKHVQTDTGQRGWVVSDFLVSP